MRCLRAAVFRTVRSDLLSIYCFGWGSMVIDVAAGEKLEEKSRLGPHLYTNIADSLRRTISTNLPIPVYRANMQRTGLSRGGYHIWLAFRMRFAVSNRSRAHDAYEPL